MEPRETRMTRSRLDCLNPNPDRGTAPPIATPINRDVVEYLPPERRGMHEFGKGKPTR
jgi:hypothetical protein